MFAAVDGRLVSRVPEFAVVAVAVLILRRRNVAGPPLFEVASVSSSTFVRW